MRQFLFSLLATACLVTCVGAAERVQMELSELQGYYRDTETESRSEFFDLQAWTPTAIYRVWITVNGAIGNGFYGCPGDGMPIDRPYKIYFAAIIPDPVTGGSWKASIGENIWNPNEFVAENGATWDFLLSNSAELTLLIWHWPMSCSGEDLNLYNPAPATVIGAILEVEGHFLVAVEPTTWGSIKAFYR